MTKAEQHAAIMWDHWHDRYVEVHNDMMEAFNWNIAHTTALNYLHEIAVEEGKALVSLEAAGVSQGAAIEYAAAERERMGDM